MRPVKLKHTLLEMSGQGSGVLCAAMTHICGGRGGQTGNTLSVKDYSMTKTQKSQSQTELKVWTNMGKVLYKIREICFNISNNNHVMYVLPSVHLLHYQIQIQKMFVVRSGSESLQIFQTVCKGVRKSSLSDC